MDNASLSPARALRQRVAGPSLPPVAEFPGAARPGEAIVLVGAIGRGGAAVLAVACRAWLSRRVPPADLAQAEAWPDGPGWDVAAAGALLTAILAPATHLAPAADAHDPPALGALVALGDGGLARACHRVAHASNVGLWLDAGTVPLHASTARICDALGLNPLDVQSAGTLFATAAPDLARAVVERLIAAGHAAAVVGKVLAGPPAVLLAMGGTQRPLGCPPRDAIDAVLESNDTIGGLCGLSDSPR